jgi:hypothetical protein
MRVERAAETSGSAKGAADRGRAAMITACALVLLPDKLYACIDGTGAPVTAKEAAGRQGKGRGRPRPHREVEPAVFFTQDMLG